MIDLLRGVSDAEIDRAAADFSAAKPFPHVVLDGWFDPAVMSALGCLFDEPAGWRPYEDGKRGNAAVVTHPIFQAFNSAVMCEVIGRVAGVPGLVSDPTLRGGGLHAVGRGGRLGIHVDFNRHRELPLARAVNTILYVNRTWRDDWQGHLTLTDRAGTERRIAPTWNRWVIFRWAEDAWHGHPEPLACPQEIERRSVAVYYYQPLEHALAFHTTRYA